MALHWKLVIDCADANALARFWARALGYEPEDNSVLIEQLLAGGMITEDLLVEFEGRRVWRDLAAIRHPEDPVDPETGIGLGRRWLFQAVPEPKSVKNRLHVDLHAGPERREAEVARLAEMGAAVLRRVDEPGTVHVVMADPEGNEFCVQ
ncbi:VOC family protein [Streptomonospora litoralis]|uniref:Glyoxalase-like domain protein n=1 Tax=Streptomonospora litoralis TaxID=2498135 RepID=A0A4P6Q5Q2_9ACTN|nr:VOC family protein [Streptomonospora litoralis]QBI54329.1 Glyoxalase-like domain protein [Streptomonospora litoralis]